MLIVGGEMVTFEVSLLDSVIVRALGAGVARLTAKVAVPPSPTVGFEGRVIDPGAWSVTLAVVSGIYGVLLAWITVLPGATPVTGTATLLVPPVNVTVVGTVATAALLELRLTVTPAAGALAERFSVRFCVAVPTTVRLCCVKFTVAFTCTGALADV
jgi:hypothetical protein